MTSPTSPTGSDDVRGRVDALLAEHAERLARDVTAIAAQAAPLAESVAALLSIIEPVVTVVAAALVFGEALTVAQVGGGLLVLVAVAVVQWPARRATPLPAEAPPARVTS